MSPSLAWLAMGQLGRPSLRVGPGDHAYEEDALAALVALGATVADPNEIHDGQSLFGRAIAQWGRQAWPDGAAPAPRETPALALINAGANPWAGTVAQCGQVLQDVLCTPMPAVLRAMLAHPACPPLSDWLSWTGGWGTPAHQEVHNDPRWLLVLAEQAFDPAQPNPFGPTALFGVGVAHLDVARALVARGVDPTRTDAHGRTAAAAYEHHGSFNNAAEREAWFDLCGRAMAPADVYRLARRGVISAFNAAVHTDPTAWSWTRSDGTRLTVLDGALHAALPPDHHGTVEPALFHHLLAKHAAWPAETLRAAALVWLAEKHRNKPVLVNHTAWRQAVFDAHKAYLDDDLNRWHETYHGESSSSLLCNDNLALLTALSAGRVPAGWEALRPVDRVMFAGWAICTREHLMPGFVPNPNHASSLQQSTLIRDQAIVATAQRLLLEEARAGMAFSDPTWTVMRQALDELEGHPFHAVLTHLRQEQLADQPSPLASRRRLRS